ncbi:hypothetical protein Tco_0344535 [Tanacetum coccineum]
MSADKPKRSRETSNHYPRRSRKRRRIAELPVLRCEVLVGRFKKANQALNESQSPQEMRIQDLEIVRSNSV